MLGSRQVNNNMYSSTNSARKENMPLSPSEMAQTVTFSTLYPNHPQSKIMQSQRVYTTNKPVSPIRLGSPREMVNGGVSGQRRI